MPGLQPVLKMKVDELFFKWLSDPHTQTQLKQYLDLIKSGQPIGLANGVAEDKKSPFGENNNVTSHRSHTGKKPAPISPPCSHPSTGALPSGSSGNPRVSGPCARTLRKSVSTKKVTFILCFLQTYHTCMYSCVFPSRYLASWRRFEQRLGCTFRTTRPEAFVFHNQTRKQRSHPELLWVETVLHNMHESGPAFFCNRCLQSSSHGLGGYAIYQQKLLIN